MMVRERKQKNYNVLYFSITYHLKISEGCTSNCLQSNYVQVIISKITMDK